MTSIILAVVNRAGAGGSIGASEMAQAKPDGKRIGMLKK
jgi:tripartite-type tricarboxylate transporter receptor subunit TctC